MFDKLKQIHKLKQMQDEFKKETQTVEKRGVSVTMNGNFGVDEIILNPELSTEEQQKALKEAINEVKNAIQKSLAQKMMGAGLGF